MLVAAVIWLKYLPIQRKTLSNQSTTKVLPIASTINIYILVMNLKKTQEMFEKHKCPHPPLLQNSKGGCTCI